VTIFNTTCEFDKFNLKNWFRIDIYNCWGCPTSVVEGVGGQFISVMESFTS